MLATTTFNDDTFAKLRAEMVEDADGELAQLREELVDDEAQDAFNSMLDEMEDDALSALYCEQNTQDSTMTVTDRLSEIIDAMLEAARRSTIHKEMLIEINQLRHNGFNTRDLFGIPAQEFILNNFHALPLAQRVQWFNSIA